MLNSRQPRRRGIAAEGSDEVVDQRTFARARPGRLQIERRDLRVLLFVSAGRTADRAAQHGVAELEVAFDFSVGADDADRARAPRGRAEQIVRSGCPVGELDQHALMIYDMIRTAPD